MGLIKAGLISLVILLFFVALVETVLMVEYYQIFERDEQAGYKVLWSAALAWTALSVALILIGVVHII